MEKELIKVRAVLFDLDGTLTDTEKYYQTAWPRALRHFGYEGSVRPTLALYNSPDDIDALVKVLKTFA